MDPLPIIERLEELLEEERIAIRTLKGERVHGIACEKLVLMTRLDATDAKVWEPHAPRVKEIVRKVRHNSVLLVHAKAILTEAVRVKRARLASPTVVASATPVNAADGRLSVVG